MFICLLRIFIFLFFFIYKLNKKGLESEDDKIQNAIPNLKQINDKCSKHNKHC